MLNGIIKMEKYDMDSEGLSKFLPGRLMKIILKTIKDKRKSIHFKQFKVITQVETLKKKLYLQVSCKKYDNIENKNPNNLCDF